MPGFHCIDSHAASLAKLVLESLHPHDGKEVEDDNQQEGDTGGIESCDCHLKD